MYRELLPQTGGEVFLTDSGLETDLIFHHGFELPEFAAFVLVDDRRGAAALGSYFEQHADLATRHRCGVVLEAPTWRANRDWGVRVGYSPAELRGANERAVALVEAVRQRRATDTSPVVVSGCVGPRGDGYRPAERMSEVEAQSYHREQIEVLAGTSADMVHAMTLTYAAEAVGIVRASAAVGVPVAISFTTETDGRLPDGSSLRDAIQAVEEATDGVAVYYGVNCAHPSHFGAALPDGALASRVRCVRANASRQSHAELDDSPLLDEGDPLELARAYARLRAEHSSLSILGGCCGTDTRHVAAIAEACVTPLDSGSR